MVQNRPRIEGFAIVSREGMIAASDGSFPEILKIPADQKFYQDSVDRAAAVANGRHSSEGGPREAARRRIELTRRVERVIADPDNANAIQCHPVESRLGAVRGGVDEAESRWRNLGRRGRH